MPNAALHVVFTLSACESLRTALHNDGWSDEVVGLSDNLSYGPLDSTDVPARDAFVKDILGYEPEDNEATQTAAFWEQSLGPSRRRIVWFSQWATGEYCGFLEWLRRNDGAPFELVDLTNATLPKRGDPTQQAPVFCTSLISAEEFVAAELWSQAKAPHEAQLLSWDALWKRLTVENAPLRVMTPEGLVSAPLDYFDADLLGHVSDTWKDVRLAIGHVMVAMMWDSFRPGGVYQTGDLLLFSRMRALVEQGVVQGRGDLDSVIFEVRCDKESA